MKVYLKKYVLVFAAIFTFVASTNLAATTGTGRRQALAGSLKNKLCPKFQMNDLTLSSIKKNPVKGVLSIGCLAPIFFDFAYLICGDEVRNYACGQLAAGTSPQLTSARGVAAILDNVPGIKKYFDMTAWIKRTNPVFDFDKKCWRSKKKTTCAITAARHVASKASSYAAKNSTVSWGFKKFCKVLINNHDLIALSVDGVKKVSDEDVTALTTSCEDFCHKQSDKCKLAVEEEVDFDEGEF